ncbi:hypothetical protein APHAL10511_008122 [Amanita phalloides]|nr:hypothetical protein APHAL10511_008122 [Amanita phalloides]
MASKLSSQPASLQEATRKSTLEWQANLKSLFQHTKDRFPDVVWELTAEDDYEDRVVEEVWGHKAIVYARAPPSFQTRYFSFKPNPLSSSPYPYPSSPTPGYAASTPSFSDDDRVPSPVPSTAQAQSTSPLRLRTSINPALFSNELEYLYTGQGFGEAFEFLYESFESRLSEPQPEGDAEELRIDKLRKDLVFMWRSRLYSDIRISLTGNFSSAPHEDTTAIFSSHRFILVSRSPYFYNALVSWVKPKSQQPNNDLFTLSLPSPPFTPASLHFTLGFLYTGTLIFSNRSYDLNTAFAILRSALYLSLDTLYDEIQARIIQEMMHGLFHAFLSFPEYERLTSSKWGTGGCRCRQCARRAPRVLEFAIADDVKNTHLERGARRALVGLFGEGWCTSEFASIPQKLRESLLKGVGKRTTPENVFPLLFAAEHALVKLNPVIDPWSDVVRDMIETGRRTADEVLCNHAEACFTQPEWVDIMENDGFHFEDGERVEWIVKAILRGMNDKNSAMLYQTLVSSILLRPSSTDPTQVMLSTTSHIRVQVEQTQADILARIGKRWLNIRQEGGFDDLEGWAIKEISDAIDVPVEDLLMAVPKGSTLRAKNTTRDGESDTASMRVSLLSRSIHSKRSIAPVRDRSSDVASSSASVYSARSTFSTTTNDVRRSTTAGNVKKTLNATSRASLRKVSSPDPRPDSKLTPPSDSSRLADSRTPSPTHNPAILGPESQEECDGNMDEVSPEEQDNGETSLDGQTQGGSNDIKDPDLNSDADSMSSTLSVRKTLINRIVIPPSVSGHASRGMRRNASGTSRPSTSPGVATPSLHAKSSAGSMRSTTSTLRKGPGSSTLRSPPGRQGAPSLRSTLSSRPISSVSTNSTSENATYKTASTYSTSSAVTARSRRLSASSTFSVGTGGISSSSTSSPVHLTTGTTTRARRSSNASLHSVNTVTHSNGRSVSGSSADRKRPVTHAGSSPMVSTRRSGSNVKSTSLQGRASIGKTNSGAAQKKDVKSKQGTSPTSPMPTENFPDQHRKSGSTTSTATLKSKKSIETITSKSKSSGDPGTAVSSPSKETLSLVPRGAMLEIGIPCIISSQRKRFKAYARYIGEVEGEYGPWVGVEVPMGSGDSWGWAGEREDGSGHDHGRQWHDGTWGGIRYFDIGVAGSEWDYPEDRSKRRRMGDSMSRMDRTTKRFRSASPAVSDISGIESRGLFVRPQQVLYVIDAVGTDV